MINRPQQGAKPKPRAADWSVAGDAHLASLAAIGLVLVTAWLRWWRLADVPPGLWFDEAYNGMDAVWMLKTGTWPVFLVGNNGREPLFHYLLAGAIALLGETSYAIRLVPAGLGILSIPVMYRWSLTAFSDRTDRAWLALLGAAGLALSFWMLTMNRAGYRANLLPLGVMVTSYFFWRGWQSGRLDFFVAAGIGLGLSQYTYLSARLLPLIFFLFVLGVRLANPAGLRRLWLGLGVMGLVSALVAGPLLFFYATHLPAFWGRVGDVVVPVHWSSAGLQALAGHVWQAVRVFIDGQDPNWRHHLLGRPGLAWFDLPGFAVGLGLALKNIRRPIYLFLLISLGVMWLPAPLSEPPFHTLRLAGLLPAYYLLVAVGMLAVANWVAARPLLGVKPGWLRVAVVAGWLVSSGSQTVVDYFYHWANRAEVYAAFDTPVVELARRLSDPSATVDMIIPFYLYSHATTRYFLHDAFVEQVLRPGDPAYSNRLQAAQLVVPVYPPADGAPPAYVWLRKNGAGPGTAIVSAVRRDEALGQLTREPGQPWLDSRGQIMARAYDLDRAGLEALFPRQLPRKSISAVWAANLGLIGYEFTPAVITPDTSSSLYLAWQILGHTSLPARMFLQLLDRQGQPLGQQELAPISRKMYRWRAEPLILEQQPLDFTAGRPAGLYFVRLGFFDPGSQQRLPVTNLANQALGDEVILGPVVVRDAGHDPLSPQFLRPAWLGDAIEFVGYSLASPPGQPAQLAVQLYWRAHKPPKTNYTAFVQVLDAHNQVVAQYDAQPLAEVYPTGRWQPGETLMDEFLLPLSLAELARGLRVVTGMYELSTGARLPAYNQAGEPLPDGLVNLGVGLP